ncbi:hypothetical protein M3O40_18395 [Xanthomonas nasturtii]|uniref:hypothetical protein n=1 Tax=Xanthomonas nasturtii TaxID=1843581 RepID=UPI002012FD8B|nr:hypothetical protein [Xanthomonas nasturtii]MCL1501217.1 hypothetical protein [Xanthomonas nasturtii]MCL1505032.1 hypothetical protein [Xanthomonas nasturtii]
MLQSARPFQRTALIDTAISTNGDAFIARLSQSVDAATLEIRPYPPPMLASSGVRAAGALGVAATLYEAQASGEKIATLLSQSNPLAAQSELAHFAGRNVGGWAGGTAAAYALGASGAGPMALIAADAYVMSKAGEKAADLLDNRAIYNQTDRAGTQWSFNGTAWTREGQADTSNDGIDNPTTTQIVASYAKARELNYQATNAAAALALKDAPAPQNPYRLPASASDPPSLSAADWARDPNDGQWRRTVQSGVVADADSAVYRTDIAPPPRAAELDAQAQQVIAGNIANSPGAIAARYELAYQRSGWAAAGLPLSDTLRQALPNPDALTASDGQQYRRDADGRWTGASGAASGNVALELDTTRALLQPALAEHAQAVAALAQTPPSAQDLQREETLYRYRITGTELKPEWREAIDLATQRTRAAHGLAGDGSMKLQRGPTGAFGADSPIAHFQRDADGVDRLAAVTSSEDIRQALQQVRAQQTQPASPDQPALHFTATGHASDGSANGDASSANASSGPQLVLDLQARSQAARVAQARQELEQQERLAQAQHAAQVREHIQQAQPEREGRSQSEQALQAHAVLDRQNQAQQREHQEREVQERQAQDNQQREQEIAQAQQVQKHAQEQQVQDARSPEQQPLHAKDAVTPEQEPRAHQVAQQVQHQTQDAQQPEPALEVQNMQAHETHTHAQTKAQQQVSHGQSQAAEMAQPHTLGQQTREQRTRDTEQRDAQTAAIAHEPSAYPQHDAIVREQQLPTAPASVAGHDVPAQQSNDPAHAHLAQMTSAPTPRSLATPMAAEHNNAQHTPTSQWQAMEALDNSAAMSSQNLLTQTVGQSLKEDRADRSADSPESVAPAIQVPSVAQTVEQDAPAAPAPGSPESWQATLQKLRALRVQLEQDLETENRISQARQARIARGQQPYTALELRDGYDPDGPSALRKIASSSQGAVSRTDADTAIAQTGSEQSDGLQPRRRAISKNSDVNDLIYAIDSKNDLAIDEALKRIANSASTHALIQRGREHLEAKAMQEAQEQVTAHQALAMDMPAEVQTSRGPVMVMTLPQFAHGPMMQGGPQGDGGGGDGGGGGGAGGAVSGGGGGG